MLNVYRPGSNRPSSRFYDEFASLLEVLVTHSLCPVVVGGDFNIHIHDPDDRDVSGTTGHTADGFAAFFRRKVDDVRASTAGQLSPSIHDTAHSTLSSFRSWTEPEVRRLIMKSPIKSCSLDPIPTFLLREQIDSMLPFITRMINASLRQGRLPDTQKHAIVTPLLKKPGLDVNDMANYRPVSNLTFLSKLIERIVAQQLNDYRPPTTC